MIYFSKQNHEFYLGRECLMIFESYPETEATNLKDLSMLQVGDYGLDYLPSC